MGSSSFSSECAFTDICGQNTIFQWRKWWVTDHFIHIALNFNLIWKSMIHTWGCIYRFIKQYKLDNCSYIMHLGLYTFNITPRVLLYAFVHEKTGVAVGFYQIISIGNKKLTESFMFMFVSWPMKPKETRIICKILRLQFA